MWKLLLLKNLFEQILQLDWRTSDKLSLASSRSARSTRTTRGTRPGLTSTSWCGDEKIRSYCLMTKKIINIFIKALKRILPIWMDFIESLGYAVTPQRVKEYSKLFFGREISVSAFFIAPASTWLKRPVRR